MIDITRDEVPKRKQASSGNDGSVGMAVIFDHYHVTSPPDVFIPDIDHGNHLGNLPNGTFHL